MQNQFDLTLDALTKAWWMIVEYLPRLLSAAALLIVGWIVARGARWITVKTLRLLRLDEASESTGFEDFLMRGGVRFTMVTLIGQTIYALVLLVFIVATGSILGLAVGPEARTSVAAYLPNIATALIVLIVGSIGARVIRRLLEAYLNNIGVRSTATIGILVHLGLLAFVAILAMEQLGMAVSLLASVFQLAFGGVCLALALAFGHGGRAWAEEIIERARSSR